MFWMKIYKILCPYLTHVVKIVFTTDGKLSRRDMFISVFRQKICFFLPCRWKEQAPPRILYLFIILHDIPPQKSVILRSTVGTSDITQSF
jgi:hypothetical protein